MSDRLTAAQLDVIEDALEGLEDAGSADGVSEDPAVVEHLAAYREILQLTRDAMPLEAAPVGALDGVFAEAREAAAVPSVTPQPASGAAQRPGLWSRLRATVWAPALAFAGAAALLVVWMRGGEAEQAMDSADDRVATRDRAEAAKREDAAPAAANEKDEGRLADAFALDRDKSADPAAAARGSAVFESSIESGIASSKADDEAEGQRADEEPEEEVAQDIPASGDGDDAQGSAKERRQRIGPRATGSVDDPLGGLGSGAGAGGGSVGSGASTPKSAGKAGKKKKGGGMPGGTKLPPASKPKPAAPSSPKPSPPPPEPAEDPAVDDLGENKKNDAGKDEPLPTQTPTAPPADADPWGAVNRGDAKRKAGSCGLARLEYDKARDSTNAGARARALAGLGLCELMAGRDGAARELFDAAKAAQRSVSSFIEAERAKIESAQAQEQSQKK